MTYSKTLRQKRGGMMRPGTPEKRFPKNFTYGEGDNEYEERQKILRKGRPGDMVSYISNNQEGSERYVIRINDEGNKFLHQIADYEGYLEHNGGRKKKSRKSRNSQRSLRSRKSQRSRKSRKSQRSRKS